MIKPRHFCLPLLLFFGTTIAFSQTFMQSAGVSFIKGEPRTRDPFDQYWPFMDFRGVSYFPRLNIHERDETAISIGLPLVFGFGFNWSTDLKSFNYVIDLPAVMDYNFGHHATKNAKGILGGYVGAGLGLTHNWYNQSSSYYGNYQERQTSYGPLARAGVRFKIPLNVGQISFALGGFYKIGLEEARYTLRGANLMMNF